MKALLRLAAAALLALPVAQVRPDEAKEEAVSVDELGEQLGVIYRKFLFTFDKPVHATLTIRVTQNGETKTEYCVLREPATAIRSCFIWKRSDPLPGGGPSQSLWGDVSSTAPKASSGRRVWFPVSDSRSNVYCSYSSPREEERFSARPGALVGRNQTLMRYDESPKDGEAAHHRVSVLLSILFTEESPAAEEGK
jgi:hypothetical protein